MLWLACRERWQADSLWFATILLFCLFAAIFTGDSQRLLWFAWGPLAGVLTLVLYLGIASQAARFFVESKRNGLIELILGTPLPSSQIVHGQWRALLRMFGLPLALCLTVQLFGAVLVQQMTWNDSICHRVFQLVGQIGWSSAFRLPWATNKLKHELQHLAFAEEKTLAFTT